VAKPDGLLVVPPGSELAFLHPLPVERLWGVGPVTSRKLREHGIATVAQVARLSEQTLVELLGRGSGRHIHALANNRDPRRVRTGVRRGSIGSQRALGFRRRRTPEELDAFLVAIVDRVARRMRSGRRVCRTVVLRLRFADAARITRSHTLAEATAHTETLLATARGLLAMAMPVVEARGISLIGISLSNLQDDAAVQLALPFERRRALDVVMDDVRDRFGSDAITRAVLLGKDPGISVPLLPD
jgi:DNA polymerase-4